MNENKMEIRHLAELGFLQRVLDEMGFPTQLLQKSAEMPYPALLVGLEPDAEGQPAQMACNFYPVDEELENTLLLQYFIQLPMELDDEGLARMRELLPDLNNRTVVGHFGLTADQNKVHYRYTQALPSDDIIDRDKVADVIMLVTSTPGFLGELLARVVKGQTSVADARQEIAGEHGKM